MLAIVERRRFLIRVFISALCVRLAYLFFNWKWGYPPVWHNGVMSSLTVAELLTGHAPTYGPLSPDALIDAQNNFQYDQRGLVLLHYGLIQLFGQSSLERLQVLQAVFDSLIACLITRTAWQCFGEKIGRRAAILYCVFPLAIYMSAVPSWYTWLNGGIVILGYFVLALDSRLSFKKNFPMTHPWLEWGVISLLFVFLSQFRSTVNFLPWFLMGWLALSALIVREISVKKMVLPYFLVGGIVLGSFALSNGVLIHNYRLVRSFVAHSFLIGVGQYENPYSKEHLLDSSDQSVYDFYYREGPVPVSPDHKPSSWETVTSSAYTQWTEARMKEFIHGHSGIYAKLVALRLRDILFPNFRVTLFADTDATAKFEDPSIRTVRLQVLRSPDLSWVVKAAEFLKLSKRYFFEVLVRISMMIFFPVGLILAFVLGSRSQRLASFLMAGPLVYLGSTTSLLRLPVFDHAAGWACCFPAVVLGWSLGMDHAKRYLGFK